MLLVLLTLVQLASFGLVRGSIDLYAKEQIGKELEVAERVFQRRLEQNAEPLHGMHADATGHQDTHQAKSMPSAALTPFCSQSCRPSEPGDLPVAP